MVKTKLGTVVKMLRHTVAHRNYKDRLFLRLFRDKKDLLSLYNALNRSSYTNPDDLIITTLEDAIFLGYKDDISFIIGSYLNLYEHQSTSCPNMPLRGFIYFSELYQGYIAVHNLNIYGTKRLELPTPRYVVLYNGTEELDDITELRLSDSFKNKEEACLECVAIVYNINAGHNPEIMKQCKLLNDYSVFIAKVREYQKDGLHLSEAVEAAIDYCMEHDILKDYLLKGRGEVKRSILTEYNPRKQRQLDIRDAREEGRKEGRMEGIELERANTVRQVELERANTARQVEAERANTVRQVELERANTARQVEAERANNIRIFLRNGGSREQAKQLLDATDEELQKVENM